MALLAARRRRPRPRRSRFRLTGSALAAVLLQAPIASAATSLEYAVKANYLYKFGPFVDWPPRAFASPASPFIVCVVGEDPFNGALDEAVRGQTVNSHPVKIRRLQAVSSPDGCNVAYIGRGGAQGPAEALRALRGAPVLTVTDQSTGVDGGVIHFVLKDGRVRFALNMAAARDNGLAISSKLITLAVAVEGSGR